MPSKSTVTTEQLESSATVGAWQSGTERPGYVASETPRVKLGDVQARRGLSGWMEPNLLLLLGGEVAARGASFIAFATLARRLRPEAFGKVECALATLMFGNLVVELGYKAIGARGVATEPHQANEWVRRIVPMQVMMGLICFFGVLAGGAMVIRDPVQRGLTNGYAATLVVIPLFVNWVFQGRRQMAWITVPQVMRQSLLCLAVVVFIRSPADVWRLPIAEMVAVVAAAALCLWKVMNDGGRLPWYRPWPTDFRLLRESAMVGGTQLLWALRNFSPVIVLSYLASDSEVGVLGAVLRLVMTMQALVMIYWTNEYPRLCVLAADSLASLQQRVRQSCWQLTVGLASVTTLCTVLAQPVLQVVYGERFAQPTAVTAFLWALCIVPVAAWRSHAAYALIVIRQQHWELIAAGCGLALLPILAWAWSPLYGAAGMAAAMLVSEIVGGALGWWAWVHVCNETRQQVSREVSN